MGSKTAARSRLLDEKILGDGFDFEGQIDYSKVNIPEFSDIPQYLPPKVDDRRVDALTQQIAAPRLRQARRATREALTRTSENPAVTAMNRRAALEGFGGALEGITSAASSAALQRYKPEFEAEREALRFGAETGFKKQLTEFKAKLDAARNIRREEPEDRTRGQIRSTGRITYGGGGRPLTPSGFRGGVQRSNPRAVSRGSSGEPVVNTKFWKGGYSQQQKSIGLSDKYNIPLESFYGSSNPESIAYNYSLDNEGV